METSLSQEPRPPEIPKDSARPSPWDRDAFTQAVLRAIRTLEQRRTSRRRWRNAFLGTSSLAASLAGVLFFSSREESAPVGPSETVLHAPRAGTPRPDWEQLLRAVGDSLRARTLLACARGADPAGVAQLGAIESEGARAEAIQAISRLLLASGEQTRMLSFLSLCLDSRDPDLVDPSLEGIRIACPDLEPCREFLTALRDHSDPRVRAFLLDLP